MPGAADRTERAVPWLLVALWLVLPFTAGTLVGDGLGPHSQPVQLVGTALAWGTWAVGLVGTLVPHPIALTALRVSGALVAVVTVWWSVTAVGATANRALGAAVAVGALGLACSAIVGHRGVNGPAYPNERRFLLRPPGFLLFGPIAVATALVGMAIVTGPMLLAARQWAAGALATAVGAAAAFVASRSLHGLSKRFVVFVPAGFVLHDLSAARDPMLFPRAKVERIRPAPADTDSLDLTQRALGLAVEVILTEKFEVTLRHSPNADGRRHGMPEKGATARFLVSPTRPGRLLQEAKSRRYSQ